MASYIDSIEKQQPSISQMGEPGSATKQFGSAASHSQMGGFKQQHYDDSRDRRIAEQARQMALQQ